MNDDECDSIRISFFWYVAEVTIGPCSVPIFPLRSHSLVCIENHLFIVRIGPTLNKEQGFIFRSDNSDCKCVYIYVPVLYDKL